MLQSYAKLRKFLSSLERDELQQMVLSPFNYRRYDLLIDMLCPFYSVSRALKDDTTTMSDLRTLFDAVIDEFPETANRLNSSAHIVLYSEFEKAIVKLQVGNVSGLSQDEALSISKLILHSS